ncbi:unnamed protein product [Adineta steineri]|uniref:RING-type domain-containing protein n=2 Tax=Adineta steineri TaxID=433720 RepID=A0A814ZMG7_9BILA|nr:unnamed protein product [Adineta steineri]
MGFDIQRFPNSIDEELICSICGGVLQDPLQAPSCEHTFCQICIQEWLSRAQTCPIDRTPLEIDQMKPVPRILKNLLSRSYDNIYSLDISCENEGCTAIVKLDLLVNHLIDCEYSPKKLVQCENGCGMMILKSSSASWFLKYIIVRDLQTMEKFYFIAQRWFSVEQGDGLIEQILPIAGEMEKQNFSYVLSKKAYFSVSDGHLWFSIFSRPPSNKFTRVQRCTCCFVLLFASMLLNIMYYDLSAEAKSTNNTESNSLSIGPLYIAPEQIGIGIMVELFSLVPSIFIVQFFRRIRPRRQISPLRQALEKIRPLPHTNSKDKTTIKNKKKQFTFPSWCLFIAYTFSFIIIAVSIFFIIVKGIIFGDLKTQQWLTSVLTGFFSSIILTQPIKILGLAVFFTLFCRNPNDDKEVKEYIDETNFELDGDEDYLHSNNFSLISHTSKRITRLNENEVAFLREQRLKEIQMWSIIREFIIYAIFLILLCIISFSNRTQNSFYQTDHLQKYFLNTRQTDCDYTQILTIDDYWNWLNNSFVENLRAQEWYNDDQPINLNGYINDKTNRMIGWATMRQLRSKSQLCSDKRIISTCIDDYNLFNEEKDSFQPGWILNQTLIEEEDYSSSILKAFQYQSSKELDTYVYVGDYGTYSGDGYVYEFRGRLSDIKSNLSKLHQLQWIDANTRAVIIQLTLYNPNVALFTSVTFLLEFLSASGVYPSARFEPLNFYVFTSLTQLICTIIYICFVIYFLIIEIKLLIKLKLKYFYEFWSLVQIGIISCSITSIIIYIWRFKEYNRLSSLFLETNGYVYVNLQMIAYVDDVLTSLLGFCCFFGTIKFIKFIRFNKSLVIFVQTLKYVTKELISFSFMFSIVFMAFLSLFYLLFTSSIQSCSSLLSTAQMLFEITLMSFDATDFTGADPFLGPFCFSIFIIIVVFICLSMFISILNDGFHHVEETPVEDQHILSYMLKKFLNWTHLRRPNVEEIYEIQDSRMRSQYVDPIENFPDKIDQLLEAIDRIYVDQKKELLKLKRAGV